MQTQVIPYLGEIMKGGVEVSLLTFEPEFGKRWGAAEIEQKQTALAEIGIKWHALAYHKRPSAPATAWDVFAGAWHVRKLLKRERYDILHGRVHIPMLMGALARKFSSHKPKLLFDIRGFFPEEYTDAGIWPENGWLYRSAKRVERWLMKEADGFVVLTEKARGILFPESAKTGFDRRRRPVEVIPCCVDPDRFNTVSLETRAEMRAELGIGERFVLAYVGAFGGWYLTEEMTDFYKAAKELRPDTFALILTQNDPAAVIARLKERGYSDNDHFVGRVASAEIPRYLSAADAALSFIKPSYSKQSSSPTKNAEYLACGLPFIANRGVGDVDELISRQQIGVLVDGFSGEDYKRSLTGLEEMNVPAARCREIADKEFGLGTVGGPRYRRLYKRLLQESE